jgi:adenosine deaminase
MSDLRSMFKTWPKIDLHRHLEGSLRLETLSEVAQEHGVNLPGYEVETIRPYVQMTEEEPHTYRNFLAKFRVLRHFYQTQQVVERVTYEAVADAADDNVRYLELRFTPSALGNVGNFSMEDVTRWVIRSVREAERDHDIRVGLILNMNRHEDISIGREIAYLAMRYKGDIVALDLGGDEVAFSARPFAPLFQQAKKEGLGITVHAGEWKGSENIIESVEYLCAERIGHGVRAIENSDVVRFVRERGIALEICPTSNLQSGVVSSPSHHPLADLLDLGIAITINTDDPSISNIDLTDEYVLAVSKLGLTIDNLKQAILNAARAAFLQPDERGELVAWFEQALADL